MRSICSLVSCALLLAQGTGCAIFGQMGRGTVSVIYYAPAWGPNTNSEQVVYFLKQVTVETASTEDSRIYFCSIKPDGSERKEIAWLWKDKPQQFLEPYATAATMEVNAATKRAAIGVEQGEMSGVFIVDLDGKNFRTLWPKQWNEDRPTTAGYPTWSPDGEWIAFHEHRFEKGFYYYRIVKMRPDTSEYIPLTERNAQNGQPAWSPTGSRLAFVEIGQRHLWLMNPDGSERRNTKAWGFYPRWSPDGKFILHNSNQIIDPTSLQRIRIYRPDLPMWPKWGKSGYISVGPNGIDFTTTDPRATRPLLPNVLRGAKSTSINEERFRW